jgi:hypothetical protein
VATRKMKRNNGWRRFVAETKLMNRYKEQTANDVLREKEASTQEGGPARTLKAISLKQT